LACVSDKIKVMIVTLLAGQKCRFLYGLVDISQSAIT